MKKNRGRIRGCSYRHRRKLVLEIYNAHVKDGLSTREILRRYIQPVVPISESTLYNYFGKEFSGEVRDDEERCPNLFEGLENFDGDEEK